MAKSTFLQLCQKVRMECGLSGSGPAAVTAQTGILEKVVSWVQDADVETQSRWLDWDFMFSQFSALTVIGDPAVAAPTDIGQWDSTSFCLDYTTTNHKQLSVLDYKTWRDTMRNGVKTNQKPSIVVVKPDLSLILESPPDAAYTLTADYWVRPLKMTANVDTSLIPEEYERIIVARAKMMYAEHDGANDVMIASQVEYDDLLDKLEAKYLPSQLQRRNSDPGAMVVRPQ